jgi:hypothetical protein
MADISKILKCRIAPLMEFHETWWSYRYMFLVGGKDSQSHILRGSKGVVVTIESYGKVEICALMMITSKWTMIETYNLT